jgi:uncharacterized protein (TIGR03437 family)
MPQRSWILVTCATLLAASEPQNIPNRDGLKQAWLEATYAIEPGFTAQNAAQNLKLSFGSSETKLVHGDAAVALRFVGYGRAGQLQPPTAALISSSKNRVEYRRSALIEWYVNDARGLEQGFTLSERVPGNGPVEIALQMSGAVQPRLVSSSEIALLDSEGRATLRYGDLRAWDARGQRLDSRLVVDSNDMVRLIVEDAGAVYPVTIDPTVTQIVLTPSDGASSARFGQSVAISGNTAIVGASFAGGQTGAAYVFVFSNGAWSQQAKLTVVGGSSADLFGTSVSLDGQTAVIGASGNNTTQGAAYIFTGSGSIWNQQVKLTATDGATGDQFGISVSVSGATVLVGASGSASVPGSAYVFTSSGGIWSQQAKLSATDAAAGDQFGGSVSLSGTTAVTGAAAKFGGTGAVYVFLSSGNSWSQQAKLTAADAASGDQFGASVAVSGDSVVAGAPGKNVQFATPLGGAYIFARTGTTWNQQAELASSDGGGAFGYSVAVSGVTAVVGEVYNLQEIGAAFVFVNSGSKWTQQTKLTASDGAPGDEVSWSVAVNGGVALVGTPFKSAQQGAVYAFVQVGTNWSQQAKMTASDTTSADAFGSAVVVNGQTALIGSPNKASEQGAVYVFVRSASDGTWSQQTKLTLSGVTDGTFFGQSISLSGDTAIIGATNAAYVYVRSGTNWTQQAKLTGADAVAGDNFGDAVTVDGDTCAVGANGQKTLTGAAYVFVRSGTTWTQQAKLIASDAVSNDTFGTSISLSGDTVLIGARSKNSFQGAAYIFVRAGTAWTQQAELAPTDGVHDNFGEAASLSGGTAIVGAYDENNAEGAVYVFVQSGTNWTQQAKLVPSDGTVGIVFGISVSIDGDLAVIGAFRGAGGLGSAYVFTRSGTTWTQSRVLTAANGVISDSFGQAVSLNGGTVISGAPVRAGGEGAAYVFALPTISSSGLVNAASFAHTVAPGSIASVFGTNYANSNIGASAKPLPDNLGNVSITVNNVAAPLIFVGQFQANFQIPFETKPGMATVVVTSNAIASQSATVNVTAEALGIFVTGTNQAVALNSDNTVADSGHPAKVGSVVVMYVTGLGALDHPLQTGSPASNDPLSNATVVPTATLGGVNAVVQFAGMSPGFVGLGQINLMVPKLAKGSYPVVIKQGAQTSNNPVISVTP